MTLTVLLDKVVKRVFSLWEIEDKIYLVKLTIQYHIVPILSNKVNSMKYRQVYSLLTPNLVAPIVSSTTLHLP